MELKSLNPGLRHGSALQVGNNISGGHPNRAPFDTLGLQAPASLANHLPGRDRATSSICALRHRLHGSIRKRTRDSLRQNGCPRPQLILPRNAVERYCVMTVPSLITRTLMVTALPNLVIACRCFKEAYCNMACIWRTVIIWRLRASPALCNVHGHLRPAKSGQAMKRILCRAEITLSRISMSVTIPIRFPSKAISRWLR